MPARWVCLALGVFSILLAAANQDEKRPPGLHDDFEGPRPVWRREESDATIRLLAHDRSQRAAHDGQLSEHLQFEAGPGSEFYYSYALPRIALSDALNVGLFVRSNRAGMRLLGRVVLPADKDPDTGQPSFVLVDGPAYRNGDRWQKLELLDVLQGAERQARILRASSRRPVSLKGAYLDRLLINVYGGPGETEVFLDDLSVTAVAAVTPTPLEAPDRPSPALPQADTPKPQPGRNSPVRLDLNYLTRQGRPWFVSAIYAPGADVAVLGRAGFNVLAEDVQANPKRFEDAITAGMMLMPMLGATKGSNVATPDQLAAQAEAFPFRESVAFWHLGTGLGRAPDVKERESERERIRETMRSIHNMEGNVSRLVTGDVEGDFRAYSRIPENLDVIGLRPICWGSCQHPFSTWKYLSQRRWLTQENNPDGLFWCWIPASAPPSLRALVWGQKEVPPWGYPQVQPEQLRLYTYIALAAGYRGIGFYGDAELTRSSGQMLLNEMALLNEELSLFESILARGKGAIPFYVTHYPDPSMIPVPGSRGPGQRVTIPKERDPIPTIRAAAIGTKDRKGVLLLVTDLSDASQYQPPQAAQNDVMLTAIVPEGAQAYEFTPAGRRVLDSERKPGGRTIHIPNFAGTTLILMTTDTELADVLEAQVNRLRSRAVTLAIEQAQLQYEWVSDINGRLAALEHTSKNAADILSKAEKSLADAQEALQRERYLDAWDSARFTSRSLRHLMRGHWEQAVEAVGKATRFEDEVERAEALNELEKAEPKVKFRDRAKPKDDRPKIAPSIISGVSSPASVAFNTLPRHYQLIDFIKDRTFGPNLVPSGDFDKPDGLDEAGWQYQSYHIDGITGKVFPTSTKTYLGTGQAIRMVVKDPEQKPGIEGPPPFLDFPLVAMRSPAVPVVADYCYRISVLVKLPRATDGGMSGILVRDSIGGEALQWLSSNPIPDWSRVVLYRLAPENGTLTVTLGLAGYGEAYFDDLRVECLQNEYNKASPNYADRTRRTPTNKTTTSPTAVRPTRRGLR